MGKVGGWGGLGPIACFHFVLESGVSFVAILHAALLSSLCSMGQMEGRLGPIAHLGEPRFFLCWPVCGEAEISHHATQQP